MFPSNPICEDQIDSGERSFLTMGGFMRNHCLLSFVLGIGIAASSNVRANYIREVNGVLTTDLPGVTIFQDPFVVQFLNRETWQINTDPAIWGRFGLESV